MSSRSATVLVIFIIAVIAFCLASVFGAMTGTISILPNGSDSTGGILDNLSAITDGTGDTGIRYGNENSDHSSSSGSNVETTTDSGQSSSSSSNSPVETTTGNSEGSNSKTNPTSSSSSSNVETTMG